MNKDNVVSHQSSFILEEGSVPLFCVLLFLLLLFVVDVLLFPYFVFSDYPKNFHLLDLLFILFWAFAFSFRDRGGFISFHNSISLLCCLLTSLVSSYSTVLCSF